MPSRRPVSIVILAWNSWPTTRACLDSLRPTLGPRDQVVVVDNGSTDETASALSRYPWVDVVSNPVNRGFAGGCNDGAAAARHDLLVFLNNDTVLPSNWIEPLVRAFDDPIVGAAGPRSNFVPGPQLIQDVPYGPEIAGMRRFAREWADSHRGQTTDTERLIGFCLATRRSIYNSLGGYDESYGIGNFEDDDLCDRIVQAGYCLVICHDSYVHHHGHKTFDANGLDWLVQLDSNRGLFADARRRRRYPADGPLLSACVLVKDEESTLADRLQPLSDLVDELVVCDLGSADRSARVASSWGATVIGSPPDDALHLTPWILRLEPGDTLFCPDPQRLRDTLRRTHPQVDAWQVASGPPNGSAHHAPYRPLIFRSHCRWDGTALTRGAGPLAHPLVGLLEPDRIWLETALNHAQPPAPPPVPRPALGPPEATPRSDIPAFLAAALLLDIEETDHVLDSCIAAGRHSTAALAVASTVAHRLPLERAVTWSHRLREAGYPYSCPLVAIATSALSPVLRARAAAVAVAMFSDAQAAPAFAKAYDEATEGDRAVIEAEASQLCPGLLATPKHSFSPA